MMRLKGAIRQAHTAAVHTEATALAATVRAEATAGGGYGAGGYYSRRAGGGLSPLDSAEAYLRAGMYEQALYVLKKYTGAAGAVVLFERCCKLSGGCECSSFGVGYAQTAVQMEPQNSSYLALLERLKAGETAYYQRRTVFTPVTGFGRVVAACMLARLCCCFCR